MESLSPLPPNQKCERIPNFSDLVAVEIDTFVIEPIELELAQGRDDFGGVRRPIHQDKTQQEQREIRIDARYRMVTAFVAEDDPF